MDIAQYLEKAEGRLDAAGLCFGHGTDNPRDEAFYLVYGLLQLDVYADLSRVNRELTAPEIERLDAALTARIDTQQPVAYLVGRSWFAGYEFLCDERALVPRSPLAELIDNGFQPPLGASPTRVLDLCTGSGCIGIATALTLPGSRVDLVDIDARCLALATENIALHGVQDRVRAVDSDLFAALDQRYDLILSNPPYVAQADYEALPAEFGHEPALGLVSDDAGLEIPLRILRDAADYLTAEGWLIMEVGYQQDALQARVPRLPLLWLEFEYGGEGVCAISARDLAAVQASA